LSFAFFHSDSPSSEGGDAVSSDVGICRNCSCFTTINIIIIIVIIIIIIIILITMITIFIWELTSLKSYSVRPCEKKIVTYKLNFCGF